MHRTPGSLSITIVDRHVDGSMVREWTLQLHAARQLRHAGQQSTVHNSKQQMADPVPCSPKDALMERHIGIKPFVRRLATLQIFYGLSQ